MKATPWTMRMPNKFLEVIVFLNSGNTQKRKVTRKNKTEKIISCIESLTVETCFGLAKGFGVFW